MDFGGMSMSWSVTGAVEWFRFVLEMLYNSRWLFVFERERERERQIERERERQIETDRDR